MKGIMGDFKILILAYLIGNSPIETQQTFQMEGWFKTMDEVVRLEFDPKKISYEKILQRFFDIHDPTTLNAQGHDIGTQYRSEIFYVDENQKKIAKKIIEKNNKKLSGKVVTKLSLLKNYCPAEDYHQKYLEKKI